MGFGSEELTPLGKAAVLLILGIAIVSAAVHIATGVVSRPGAFWLAILGFVLFAAAKFEVIASGRWVTFGTAPMSESVANLYRVGYWLITVGILATFGG